MKNFENPASLILLLSDVRVLRVGAEQLLSGTIFAFKKCFLMFWRILFAQAQQILFLFDRPKRTESSESSSRQPDHDNTNWVTKLTNSPHTATLIKPSAIT